MKKTEAHVEKLQYTEYKKPLYFKLILLTLSNNTSAYRLWHTKAEFVVFFIYVSPMLNLQFIF